MNPPDRALGTRVEARWLLSALVRQEFLPRLAALTVSGGGHLVVYADPGACLPIVGLGAKNAMMGALVGRMAVAMTV